MSKDFYLSLFPIGNANWKSVWHKIAWSVTLHDSAYACSRFIDQLIDDDINNDSLPFYGPNEAIHVDGDVKFRFVIGYPLLPYIKNDEVLTPWEEESMPYYKACDLCLDKVVSGHSDYVIILRNGSDDEIVAKVIETCIKYHKKYMIISEDDNVRYDDIYNYFFTPERGQG